MKSLSTTILVISLMAVVLLQPLHAEPGETVRGYTACAWGSAECNPCVQDVTWSVETLRRYGDLLGFHMSGHDVTIWDHWQGIQRLMVAGARYLVISRNHEDVGAFAVVDMASRNLLGERFRSNRLGASDVEDTVPPSADRIEVYEPIDSDYAHAGGIQAIGHWLVVPLESSHSGADAQVVFYDLAEPASPIRRFAVDAGSQHAGTASITRLSDGRYLLVIGGYHADPLNFYVSSGTNLTADPGFSLVDEWTKDEAETEIGDANWGAYENINLVNECDGQLYLIGLHNQGWPAPGNQDWIDAWRLEMDANTHAVRLVKVAKRHVYCSWGFIEDQCNLDTAAGVYVDPGGRLIAYATTHNDDGPASTTSFEEFRNQYWPTSCQGIEDAWSELYDDTDYGDRSLMIDFVDRDLEAYDDFRSVEGFGDKTSSARWCLPPGYRTALYRHHDFGDLVTTLDGDGTPGERNVTSDETSSARFEGQTETGWYRVLRRSLWGVLGGPLADPGERYLMAGTHYVPTKMSLIAMEDAMVLFKAEAKLSVHGTMTADGGEGTVWFVSAMDQRSGIRIASEMVVQNGGEIKMHRR